MRIEPMQQMMTVLPDGFDYDQRGLEWNVSKHLHAALLAVDEAMPLGGIVGMAALDLEPLAANGGHDRLFCPRLRGPALLVGGEPQVTIGDKDDTFGHFHILTCYREPGG